MTFSSNSKDHNHAKQSQKVFVFYGNLFQGHAQKFEKGGGANFKTKPAEPDIKISKKKGHHARRLSFIRILPLLSAFVCGGGARIRPPSSRRYAPVFQNKFITFWLFQLFSSLHDLLVLILFSVEPLPFNVRKLLRWRMSTITPHVVKNTILRSGFKPTKSKSF